MAGKALNKKNLTALGADVLAELLLEAVKGDAARQRRVRMALSTDQSPREAAADIRKRLAQIRRAKSWINAQAQSGLAKELDGLIDVISKRIAPEEPGMGFDLLWSLLQIAPLIYARTDDSNGEIGDVMDSAMQAISDLAPRLDRDPIDLADEVFEALCDNGYGEFDGAIPALAKALGETGLTKLKERAEAAMQEPISEAAIERYGYYGFGEDRRAEIAKDSRDRTMRMMLQDIADQQGDVDAWMSEYTAEQLTFHTIAPDAARRLLDAGRAEDALRVMQNCLQREEGKTRRFDTPEVDTAHFACLEALGREEDLRKAMWDRFEQRLCAETLRRYLSRLPDFDDDEALLAAQAHIRSHDDLYKAVIFCLQWPDPKLAGEIVLARAGELDGNVYQIMTPLADALEPEAPLAAALVWRSMISFALDKNRASRYRHAARHLASCARVDIAITDYGAHPNHDAFVAALREKHGRKSSFWDKVEG